MVRILLTGMCSVQDRCAFHGDSERVYYRPFTPRIRTHDEFIRQFSIAGNTGNYLITEGAYYACEGHALEYVPFWHLHQWSGNADFSARLRGKFDFCVFVTANILNADFDLGDEAQVLENLAMPTIFMSIGVQRRSDLASGLRPGAARVLEFLKRPTSQVFTRGAYAAAFLRSQGVANVHEACCPSAFYRGEDILRGVARLKAFAAESVDEIWLNGYLGGNLTFFEFRPFLGMGRRVGYVFQDEPLLYQATRNLAGQAEVYDDGAARLLAPPAYHPLEAAAVAYYAFFSPEVWRARASVVDLLVGRRFHGNLVGLQAGRPALFFGHDDRVIEMLTSIGMPFIDLQQWFEASDRPALFEAFVKGIDVDRFGEIYTAKRDFFRAKIREIIG